MSGNKTRGQIRGKHPRQKTRKADRRSSSTRERLGEAIIALIQEKSLYSVRVQDVLDRAGVARSTFYAHYEDTNDLLLSDMEDFLEKFSTALSRAGDKSRRVAPVRELFAHVAEQRKLYGALLEANRMHDFLELAQEHFARGIAHRLGEIEPKAKFDQRRRAALGHAHAGALFSLLTWWIHAGDRPSPGEMDELFHRTVWGGDYAAARDTRPERLASHAVNAR